MYKFTSKSNRRGYLNLVNIETPNKKLFSWKKAHSVEDGVNETGKVHN